MTRTVLRGRFGLWVLGIASAVVLYLVVDAVARGYLAESWPIFPWLLLFLWVLYLLLVRPAVIVDDADLVVVNVLRRHVMPWGSVEDVRLRYQVVVVLRDGSHLTCWGAPAVGLDRTTGVAPTVGDPSAGQITGIKRLLYTHIDAAEPAQGEQPPAAHHGWDVVGVVGTVVVLVLAALTFV